MSYKAPYAKSVDRYQDITNIARLNSKSVCVISQTRTRFILCQGLLKQSFLTLQFLTRQHDQEFDKQCILPVN